MRQGLALLAVVEDPVLPKDETVFPRVLDHLRCPGHAAAGIIAAKDRHDHSVVGADVLEPAKNPGRNVEDVAFLGNEFAGRAIAAPEEAPASLQHEEDFGCGVVVKRVAAMRRLSRGTDIEADLVGDVDVLVGTFRNPAADDGEVFLLVRARRMGVDEGSLARLQFTVANDAIVDRTHVEYP